MAAVLMSGTALIILVCCFLLVDSQSCASSCSCLGSYVDCSNKGLINIPNDIPPWATKLHLQKNAITEIRPDDLKGLIELQELDLSSNSLTTLNGSVFMDLTGLTTLKLDNNDLTQIPRFPMSLSVTKLTMANNHVGSISMSAMTGMAELTLLDLSSNDIFRIANGSFPRGSKLTHLNLNDNKIVAIDKGSMGNLTLLDTLKVNKNKLSELPVQVFQGMNRLKTLELMRNKIKVIKAMTFNRLESLTTLKLKRNQISLLNDAAFYELPELTNLHLDHNDISNITMNWLYGLKTLKQLSLGHNKIPKIDENAWKECERLEKLDLGHNRLGSLNRTSLLYLGHLQHLKLDHNHISSIHDGAFRHLPELTILELASNKIAEDANGAFQGLNSLRTLGLQDNSVRSIELHAFAGIPRLRHLNLTENNITDISENAFETLRELRELTFNSSRLLCDCSLAWLPGWLRGLGFQSSAVGTCFYPSLLKGASLHSVATADFTCNDADSPKPVIIESPKSMNGSKGQNMTLTCITAITGDANITVHWKKDSQKLPPSLSTLSASSDGRIKRFTSNLTLLALDDADAGRYQCLVANEFGKVLSQRAYVKVFVYPKFKQRPKDVTVKAGKPAELKCSATGQPTPVISWQKDGGVNFPAARERRMSVYPNDERFYILDSKVADEGVYSCFAKNDAGIVVTNATVTVLETPDFVRPMMEVKTSRRGETTVLQCMASGSPQPKLTWMKDDSQLVMTPRHFFTVNNQLLVIVDTQLSDAGVYACSMSNSLGMAKGSTQLQVLSASGELAQAGGGGFGLDDESTTTGIIIIAVVCCVVGTSLVWVIIIYQTRKRHQMYSGTPTDETTLPGEVPSSGYMSSDKEGSYSQGALGTYHFTSDYQMKESGYESSSGQFRVSGFHRPGEVDEDESPPPITLTAGDRLLRNIKSGHSASSLGDSDGDTMGSGHSTSSGQHSGSSNNPSSHSGHSPSPPLVVTTGDLDRNTSPAFPSPGSDDSRLVSVPLISKQHILPEPPRPILQTFHPTKMYSTVSATQRADYRELEAACRPPGRRRRHSDVDHSRYSDVEGRDPEAACLPPPLSHCPGCQHTWTPSAINSNSTHTPNYPPEIHQNNYSPCRLHDQVSVNSVNELDSVSVNKRYLIRDTKPSANPSARSIGSQTNEKKNRPPGYYEVCKTLRNNSYPGKGGSLDRESAYSRSRHNASTNCEECERLSDNVHPPPTHVPRVPTPTPCCCEALRDSRYCPSHSQQTRHTGHSSQPRTKVAPSPNPGSHQRHRMRVSRRHMERSRSSNSVREGPYHSYCDTPMHEDPVYPGYQPETCDFRLSSLCPDCQQSSQATTFPAH